MGFRRRIVVANKKGGQTLFGMGKGIYHSFLNLKDLHNVDRLTQFEIHRQNSINKAHELLKSVK